MSGLFATHRAGLVVMPRLRPPLRSPSGRGSVAERLKDGIASKVGERRWIARRRDDLVRVAEAAPGPFFARQSLMTVAGAASRRRSK